MVSHAAQRSSIALKLKRNSQPYCISGRVCVPAAQSPFVLVMGSKNNNGKFDFKAAGPRWTAFRKERVLQGYRMTLTWMVSQSCGGVGRRHQQFATIFQVDKKGLFVPRSNHCVIWDSPNQHLFSFLVPWLDRTWESLWNTGDRVKTKHRSVYLFHFLWFWFFFSVLFCFRALNCSACAALSHSCGSRGKTITFNCEILLLAAYKTRISWLVSKSIKSKRIAKALCAVLV